MPTDPSEIPECIKPNYDFNKSKTLNIPLELHQDQNPPMNLLTRVDIISKFIYNRAV